MSATPWTVQGRWGQAGAIYLTLQRCWLQLAAYVELILLAKSTLVGKTRMKNI